MPNQFKFQEQEHIDDLNLGWDSFKWRNHQPDIGRFFNVDPLAEKYTYNSPYAFSENKVVAHRELEGLESWSIHEEEVSNVKATPEWSGSGNLTGYNVTFTLSQHITNYNNDENNVAIGTEEINSVSDHTVHLDGSGAPTFLPETLPKLDRQNPAFMKNIPVKGSIAKVTTKTTPVTLNGEGKDKSTTKTSLQKTGVVVLNQISTAKIKAEQKRQEPSVLTRYVHFMLGKKDEKKGTVSDAPSR